MTGQLRNTKSGDQQAFPGSAYVATGTVPKPQCTEAVVQGDNANTISVAKLLRDTAAFTGFNLVGKVCHITASVGGFTGDFNITGNNDDALNLQQSPGDGDPVSYYISDGGALEKQQTAEELMNEAHAQGAATTRKGGQVFIDGTQQQVQPSCSILFDPE